MSFLEIYNETIRDLLSQSDDKHLDLREDPVKGIQVNNLNEIMVKGVQEIMTMLKFGNKKRQSEATGANDQSSRSHAIL